MFRPQITGHLKTLLAVVLLAIPPATASTAVLLQESFSYPNGSLVAVGGASWQTLGGTPGQIAVLDSRVTMNLASSKDVQTFLSPPPSTDAIYAGFPMNFSALPACGQKLLRPVQGRRQHDGFSCPGLRTDGRRRGRIISAGFKFDRQQSERNQSHRTEPEHSLPGGGAPVERNGHSLAVD